MSKKSSFNAACDEDDQEVDNSSSLDFSQDFGTDEQQGVDSTETQTSGTPASDDEESQEVSARHMKRKYDTVFLFLILNNLIEAISLSPHAFTDEESKWISHFNQSYDPDKIYISKSNWSLPGIISVKSASVISGLLYLVHKQLIHCSFQRKMPCENDENVTRGLLYNNAYHYFGINRANYIDCGGLVWFLFRTVTEVSVKILTLVTLMELFNHDEANAYYFMTLLLISPSFLIESIIETGISVFTSVYNSDRRLFLGSIAEYNISNTALFLSKNYHISSIPRTISLLTVTGVFSYNLSLKFDITTQKMLIAFRVIPIIWTLLLDLHRAQSIRESRKNLFSSNDEAQNESCIRPIEAPIPCMLSILNLSFVSYLFSSCIDSVKRSKKLSGVLSSLFLLLGIGLMTSGTIMLTRPNNNDSYHYVAEGLIIAGSQIFLFLLGAIFTNIDCTREKVLTCIQFLSSSSFMALISATSLSEIIEPIYDDPTGLLHFTFYLTQMAVLGIPGYFRDRVILSRSFFSARGTNEEGDSIVNRQQHAETGYGGAVGQTDIRDVEEEKANDRAALTQAGLPGGGNATTTIFVVVNESGLSDGPVQELSEVIEAVACNP